MTTRSRSRALLVLAATAVAVLAATAVPAGGLEQEPLTISEGQVVEGDYGPIPGNNAVLVHYPDGCATATYCDVIPLDVVIPEDLGEADDFIVKITLSWPESAADTPGYRGSTNDLDMYIYDDKQKETAEPPEDGSEPGYTEMSAGATDGNPEQAQLFRPTLGRYNIVVNNFLGTNVGYSLKLEWQSFDVDTPFEVLAPPPGSGTRRTTTTTTTAPTTTTTGPTSTTVSIPEAVVLPDDDFDDDAFDPGAAVEEQVAIGEQVASSRAAGRQATSPSALTVILWMVVLPAVLVGGAALLVARRRGAIRLRRA